MTKFRLKPEAVPFFKEKYATQVMTWDAWDKLLVDREALEEVQPLYATYGHRDKKNTSSLSGWNEEEGSHFHFTLHFPSVKFREHDKFSNGRTVRSLMNSIQQKLDDFQENFSKDK